MLWMGFATAIFQNQIHADLMARRFILSSIFFFCLGIAAGLNYEPAKEKLRRIPSWLLLVLLGLAGYLITVIRMDGVRLYGHYYEMLIPHTTYFFGYGRLRTP